MWETIKSYEFRNKMEWVVPPIIIVLCLIAYAILTGLFSADNITVDRDFIAPLPTDYTVGNIETADILVVSYLSPTCPHCRDWVTGSLKDIKATDFFKDGKIAFILRHVPLNKQDMLHLETALCLSDQEQERYFEEVYSPSTDIPLAVDKGACGETLDSLLTHFRLVKSHGFPGTPWNVVFFNHLDETDVLEGDIYQGPVKINVNQDAL